MRNVIKPNQSIFYLFTVLYAFYPLNPTFQSPIWCPTENLYGVCGRSRRPSQLKNNLRCASTTGLFLGGVSRFFMVDLLKLNKPVFPTLLQINNQSNLRLSPTTPKIQDPFVFWVALQVKGSIPIRHLLQQQDSKENHFCKWVSRREDVHIWVVSLRQPKIGIPYRYSVGGWF